MKKILIIVDAQNDFCHIDGALSTPEACKAADNIILKLDSPAFDFDEIYCTKDTHDDGYHDSVEGRHLPVDHCLKLSWGWKMREDIYRALYNQRYVTYIEKNKFAPSVRDIYDNIGMLERGDKIYVCGLCTDICVVNTALAVKNFMECEVYLIEDCCAGSTPENHEAAIKVMKASHINVI